MTVVIAARVARKHFGTPIAVTYAIATSLYFVLLLVLVGPGMMQQEGETSYVKASAGVSIAFASFGAVFSAVISLCLKHKLPPVYQDD